MNQTPSAVGELGDELDPPKPPTLRDQQRDFTRLRLIECAADVISEFGLANATVNAITKRARASRATFYLHFDSIDDVLAAIGSEALRQAADLYPAVDEALAQRDRERLRSWVVDALKWSEEHAAIVKTLQYAFLAGAAPIFTLTDQMPSYVRLWPNNRQEEAEFRIRLFVDMVTRTYLLRQFPGQLERSEDDALIDTLVAVGWDLLLPATLLPGR